MGEETAAAGSAWCRRFFVIWLHWRRETTEAPIAFQAPLFREANILWYDGSGVQIIGKMVQIFG